MHVVVLSADALWRPSSYSRRYPSPAEVFPNPTEVARHRARNPGVVDYGIRVVDVVSDSSGHWSCASKVKKRGSNTDYSSPNQGKPSSIPGGVAPGFSHVGIVPGNGRRSAGLLGDLPFPLPVHSSAAPYSPRFNLLSALKTSLLRATQISYLTHSSGQVIGSRKSRSSCGPTGSSLAESSRVNVQAKQSGHLDLIKYYTIPLPQHITPQYNARCPRHGVYHSGARASHEAHPSQVSLCCADELATTSKQSQRELVGSESKTPHQHTTKRPGQKHCRFRTEKLARRETMPVTNHKDSKAEEFNRENFIFIYTSGQLIKNSADLLQFTRTSCRPVGRIDPQRCGLALILGKLSLRVFHASELTSHDHETRRPALQEVPIHDLQHEAPSTKWIATREIEES
ncbi:hypothetical protein PR048_033206 [Dryococelus australis]|uniref:Uncharacterized protein n=1 Tax=Dryococelus australis TaxID=614101 RepID=A0ABQ9FZL7_9NEOP|nr:hypothetical protein PR048_033206 [Dryococelus australis]